MLENIFFSHKDIIKVLQSESPVKGKRQLEPFKKLLADKKLPFSIIEDHEATELESEVHKTEGDLWVCLEGEAEFVYGGEMIEPWTREGYKGNEIAGKGLRGGTTISFKPGDWLWIPPGQPHMHTAKNTVRMAIIKIRS